MSGLRLFAIAIDQVRDIFGADDRLAARLRTVVSKRFTAPLVATRPKRSLLSRLGPVMRRPIDPPTIPLDQPLAYDAENLLASRFITNERLGQAWEIMLAWLEDLSDAETHVPLSHPDAERLEFALAFAGLTSEFAISSLLSMDPAIPLRPAPGMMIGYSRGSHALAAGRALADAAPGVTDPAQRDIVATLTDFLTGFPDDTDLFGVWRD